MLGVPKVAVIGHLLCLWWWAQAYAPADGDLSGFDADDLADAAEWPAIRLRSWRRWSPAVAAARVASSTTAAAGCGSMTGRIMAVKVHVKRAQGAERQQRFRSAHGAAPGNAAVTAGDSAGNAHVTHSNALRNGDVTPPNVDIRSTPGDPGVDLSSGVAADLQSSGAGAPGAVGASVPLSAIPRNHGCTTRRGANRPAILRAWYIACFGDSGDVPGFLALRPGGKARRRRGPAG